MTKSDKRKDEIATRIAKSVEKNYGTTVMYDASWIVELEIEKLIADIEPAPDDVAEAIEVLWGKIYDDPELHALNTLISKAKKSQELEQELKAYKEARRDDGPA